MKMAESFKDFNWDLNLFVEYRSPFTRKETLPMQYSLTIYLLPLKKTNLDFRGGTEIVFDLK